MDLDGGEIHNEGRLKGWALKSTPFWALKWQRAQRVPLSRQHVFSQSCQFAIFQPTGSLEPVLQPANFQVPTSRNRVCATIIQTEKEFWRRSLENGSATLSLLNKVCNSIQYMSPVELIGSRGEGRAIQYSLECAILYRTALNHCLARSARDHTSSRFKGIEGVTALLLCPPWCNMQGHQGVFLRSFRKKGRHRRE